MHALLTAGFVAAALAILGPAAQLPPPGTLFVADAATANAALLEAGEPFEELTEKAFVSSLGKLGTKLRAAAATLAAVREHLSLQASSEAAARLGEAEAALASGARSDLAIASVEIYRILVGSLTPPTTTPTDVSLLDYAGFRYDADLKSEPPRWVDMLAMVRYARARWSDLRRHVDDAGLVERFELALAGMENGARLQDPVLASNSVHQELDLVDDFERYFKRK